MKGRKMNDTKHGVEMKNYQLAAFAASLMTLCPPGTVFASKRVDDDPTPTSTHHDDEALAKAQAKRDRKAAKRLTNAEKARRLIVTMRSA